MEVETTVQGFWSFCLDKLRGELPNQQFSTWINPLSVVDDGQGSSDVVSVVAPNRFVLQWIRERYLPRVQQLAEEYWGDSVKVVLVLPKTSSSRQPSSLSVSVASPTKGGDLRRDDGVVVASTEFPAPVASSDHSRSAYERTRLNIHLNFAELVRGKANDLANAAARQVAQSPGYSYNPLFIYGGVGLGKTHLIQAIGNEAFRNNSARVVRYIHANDYYADVVKAYQQGSFDSFARYYRSLDVLLIDDIQFFNNKTRTQEEFFHVFNALIESKKQIVITCDTYPKDITGLSDRLISRFDWGLTVAIEPPEPEMRVAILMKKAESEGIILHEDVSFFIAKHLKSNVRELEGALNKVLAYARFHGRDITLELAREALKDLLNTYNRQITIDLIQKTVADYFKIKVSELYSKKRSIGIARPRQIAMALARELTPASLPLIGEAFGGRDHTTVLHACRHVASLRQKDPRINHDVHVLLQVLKG
ncbi:MULTISPECIES: chromosomal replication initiator protein DnaA [Candidatus Ichthyocystis]|uniref:Chromosomal replication initiator protein DnaA n=1 Tax=Candidatus Ichthyocystis hellenicum TaxID=1561003 RepID=A0A0S4M781_9BURK|nr:MULTISPECIES: chromosomal replication initiator protein DnaA [Ichthyocystis]CUT17252.1 Chromosomal replication initiator protein DnaA [Candidatus Ichthyocystis hellenicum]